MTGARDDGDSDAGGDATAAGSFLLDSGSEIKTEGGSAARAGGDVTIKTTVRSASLASATDGDIEIKGTITTDGGTATAAGLDGGAVNMTAGVEGTTAGTITIFTGANINTIGSAAASSSNANGGAGGAVTLNTHEETIVLTDTQIDSTGGAKDGGGTAGAGGTITISDNLSILDGDSSGVVLTSGATAGNVVLSGTVDGGTTLSLTSGTGSLTLGGVVGGGTNPTGLTISGPAITLNHNISVAGNVEITAPVTLGAGITIDTNTGGTDGNITFKF